MSSASRAVCPRWGSTDLDLESASLNGETADETTTGSRARPTAATIEPQTRLAYRLSAS
jgi:hypothetical protein